MKTGLPTSEIYKQVASRIIKARFDVKAINPISNEYPEWGLVEAYQVQRHVNQARRNKGGRVVGYKIGLTSKAVQEQLGVDQPDYGELFSDMERLSGSNIDCSKLIAPKAEGEIAFVFRNDLDKKDLTFVEMMSEVEFFMPVVEIVDSVITDWKIKLVDTVADNASSALYVVGNKIFNPRGVDFSMIELRIKAEGMTDVCGKGTACLGNPLLATWWLAKKMIDLGTPIRKGNLVLSGALAPMVNLTSGISLEFEFLGLDRLIINT